jgi:hypothetical protein
VPTAVVATAPGLVAPPPPSGGPHHREIVLHLRDLVNGIVWLDGQPEKALSPSQQARLAPLLGAVRANLQGPPSLVDEKLEGQVKSILSEAQFEAIKTWTGEQKTPADFMASLAVLERHARP